MVPVLASNSFFRRRPCVAPSCRIARRLIPIDIPPPPIPDITAGGGLYTPYTGSGQGETRRRPRVAGEEDRPVEANRAGSGRAAYAGRSFVRGEGGRAWRPSSSGRAAQHRR